MILVAGARYYMERRAGRTLCWFPWNGVYFPKLQRALFFPSLLMASAVIVVELAVATWGAGQIPGHSVARVALAIFGGGISAALVMMLFILSWGRQMSLCERGILYLGRTFLWEQYTRYRWHRRHPDVLVIIGPRKIAMFVAAEQREAVEALLKEKLEGARKT